MRSAAFNAVIERENIMRAMEFLNNRNNIGRQPKFAVVLLIALLVSACTGSDNLTVSSGEVSSSENTNSSGSETMNGSENMGGSESNNAAAVVKFPTSDSGPESLIVTGLDSTNPDTTSAWLVNVRFFRQNVSLGTTGKARVDLVKYNDDFPVSRHVDFYSRNLDTCVVGDLDTSPPATIDDSGQTDDALSISGGSTVVINTPSGPWHTLNRTNEDGQNIYISDKLLPGELLPADTTLSIPGDVFPTVAAHPLFDPISPDRLSPEEDVPVTADSVFTWIPVDGKNFMRISLLAYNDQNELVGVIASCNVKDNGSFTMPADVTDIIATTPYRLQARYARNYHRLDFVNGIVIRQRTRMSE